MKLFFICRLAIGVSQTPKEYCVKGEESWIVWDDTTYNHMIISTKVEEPKELLLEMAESLYQ